MKVVHLEREFIKPTETFIVNQINGLALSGDVENFVFTAKYEPHLEAKTEVCVPPPKFLGSKWMRGSHRKFFEKEKSRIGPDIFHAHFITDACLFHPVTKTLSVPKICSCYGYDVTEVPVKFKLVYKPFYSKIIQDYDCFLAMSEDMKVDLMKIGVPENKIIVHYHGINTRSFNLDRNYGLANETLQLLTISRLGEKKGHIMTLTALKFIVDAHPEVKFQYHIVGTGPLDKKLKRFVQENGLTDHVFFHGLIKHGAELEGLLKKADVFVHPSVTTATNDKEGIPGAVVEAMTSGLPVISTYHAGIPEVITHDYNGILIAERDDVRLAEELLGLYSSEEKRKRLGVSAVTYANDELDYLGKAEKLKSIYSMFLEKNKLG